LFVTIYLVLWVWAEGLWSIARLLAIGVEALLGKGGAKAGLAAAFAKVPTQLLVLNVIRAFMPNFAVKAQLMKAYENTGSVVISRYNDCLDVLNRNEDFEVVYGPRMRKLTAGENFFLGMQPGWDYTRDTSAMHLSMRRTDVELLVEPRAAELASQIVTEQQGKIDLPADLGKVVPWDMTDRYFGAGATPEEMIEWTGILFWYLFQDLTADPSIDRKAMDYAGQLRTYLDATVAKAKENPSDKPTVLNRCLALQASDTPGMDDLGIRNNLLGILIGAIPTISKSCCFVMDELLRRPDALASAHGAALAGDDNLLAQHCWEALRFNPHNPVVYRRATRDAVVAPATLRRQQIKKGQMVFAASMSACFDRYEIPNATEFRTDRPWENYIIWGYGMHNCFGSAINSKIIPAILKPLLARKNVRRAPGAAGEIETDGTPHPQHFHLEYDA
jgi:cytochrome P450